jgi:hypothetical protein
MRFATTHEDGVRPLSMHRLRNCDGVMLVMLDKSAQEDVMLKKEACR